MTQSDQSDIDGQVLAALRARTFNGKPAVMSPKQIAFHIGQWVTGTGWGPSPQAVTASLKRLARDGLVERIREVHWREIR